MKRFKILLFLILISNHLLGQLQVDAGKDTIICVSSNGITTPTTLGGIPSASGGSAPYQFAWSTNYKIGESTYTASYFLDDTTKANPEIKNYVQGSLIFTLTVTDKNGDKSDSKVTVRFSQFSYLLSDNFAYISPNDTITLNHNIGSGIKPLSFSWSPNYNITDTSASTPKASPDTSLKYKVIAIDSAGCVSEPDYFEVIVKPLGLPNSQYINKESTVFPNPINQNSTITISTKNIKNLRIKILNENGKTILLEPMNESFGLINKISQNGLYIYFIYDNEKIISKGRFVKR